MNRVTKVGLQQHVEDDRLSGGLDFTTSPTPDDDTNAIDVGIDGQRALLQMPPCPGGGGPISLFTLDIKFIPQGGFNTNKCTTTLKQKIGTDLNTLLKNYGIGKQGAGDNAVYLAKVCTKPIAGHRRLQAIGFLWKGGGTCRQCNSDNADKRQLQNYDPNWFKNIYAPELQNILRNAITNTIAPKFVPCLGHGPQVLVTVKQVSSQNSYSGCN